LAFSRSVVTCIEACRWTAGFDGCRDGYDGSIMKLAAGCFLLATTSVFAQTAATKPAVKHSTAAKTGAGAVSANAPGIPRVVGVPKTLYALRYIDTVVGKGELAVPRKWYTVNYTGWLTNGTKFDSSYDRNQPITFPYGARRVIAGWDTGFEGMHVGGKRRLIIPYELAYGEMGNEKIPPKSTLIFDVELLGMSDTPPAPPAKPSVPAAPASGTGKPEAAPSTAPKPSAPATPPPAPAPATPGTATPPPSTTPGPPSGK
jgi:peptidylprolyl isomerase